MAARNAYEGDLAPFRKGEGGRPKGSRNKFHKQFIEALAKDFEGHGADVIRIVRAEEPATYLKIMACGSSHGRGCCRAGSAGLPVAAPRGRPGRGHA